MLLSINVFILDGIARVANLSHPVNVTRSSELLDISTEDVALDRDFIIDIRFPSNPPSILTAVEQYESNKYATHVTNKRILDAARCVYFATVSIVTHHTRKT